MHVVVIGILAIVFEFAASGASAAKCGADPGDMPAVQAVRAQADDACNLRALGCANAPTHHLYVGCIEEQAKSAVVAGRLPPQCKSAVVACAVHSTCAKSAAVTCCSTSARGTTACRIKASATACTAPLGGLACVGSVPSCCDACGPEGCVVVTTTTTTTIATTTTLPGPCGTEQYPTCGGSCAGGLVCAPQLLESPIGPSFPQCACTPPGVLCTDPHPETCANGVCPPGLACHRFTLITCSDYRCVDPAPFP